MIAMSLLRLLARIRPALCVDFPRDLWVLAGGRLVTAEQLYYGIEDLRRPLHVWAGVA